MTKQISIRKLWFEMLPELGNFRITRSARDQLRNELVEYAEEVLREASRLCEFRGGMTITDRDIREAVRVLWKYRPQPP